MTEIAKHACRNPKSDDSADHHCIGPHGYDEPWYCVDCGHEGPEVVVLPDGTLNGNALIHLDPEVRAAYEGGTLVAVGQLLTAECHEPGRGVTVGDAYGRLWRRTDDNHNGGGGANWEQEGVDYFEPESWTFVAGNCGPVRVVEVEDA